MLPIPLSNNLISLGEQQREVPISKCYQRWVLDLVAGKNSRRDTKSGCALRVYLENRSSERAKSTHPRVGAWAYLEEVALNQQLGTLFK